MHRHAVGRSSKGNLDHIIPLALLAGITWPGSSHGLWGLRQAAGNCHLSNLSAFTTDAYTASPQLTFTELNRLNICICIYILIIYLISLSLFLLTGNLILHTKMAVEVLGGWQNSCAHHGLRYRHLFRSREKTKKEITFRLFMGKFKVSQATLQFIAIS